MAIQQANFLRSGGNLCPSESLGPSNAQRVQLFDDSLHSQSGQILLSQKSLPYEDKSN